MIRGTLTSPSPDVPLEQAKPAHAPASRTKTCLMIDYYFPPLAGAGALRTLGFVRHLSLFGWEPIVLTVRSGDCNFYDESLLREIPLSVDVQRTAAFEPLKVARWLFTRPVTENNRHGSGLPGQMGAWERAVRQMRGLEYWVCFPDRNLGWAPFAAARALRLNRRRTIDLVYSTSTAITSHLIGYTLKKLLGKPWVADFQDAWAEHPALATRLFPSALHARMACRLERLILRSADRVVVTADPLRRTFEKRDQRMPAGKVAVIPMGYDASVFERARAVPRARFTITHFGSFYAARSPKPFLEALGQCVQEHPELAGDLEVLFLGLFDPTLRSLALATIDRWKLQDIVRLEGAVPYEAGASLLLSSNVLLLIGDPGEWHRSAVPTKVYEYLAAKRPILALLPQGPGAEIVRAAEAGMIVPPDDIPAIREAIWDLYRRDREGRPAFSTKTDVAEQYAWLTLAKKLALLFDGAFSTYASPAKIGVG